MFEPGLARGPRLATLLFVFTMLLSFTAHGADAPHPQSLAGSVLSDIDQASWIAEGDSPHIVYIFFDPNCPYCHKVYEATRSWVKSNKLQLRWIPVGILLPTSHGKAVAMLAADDPLKAFYKNEDKYTMGDGGIDEDLGNPEVEKRLSANEALLSRTGIGAVPLLLFHSKDGEPILIQGAPPTDKLPALFAHVK